MKIKSVVAGAAVLVVLAFGVIAVIWGFNNYQASNVVVTKQDDGTYTYENIEPDGVADDIVAANVYGIEGKANNTNAVNNVAAIVFDFRGYDTLGESFILLTAIAGTFVILSRTKKKKKEEVSDEV